jgi:hypothetical protein
MKCIILGVQEMKFTGRDGRLVDIKKVHYIDRNVEELGMENCRGFLPMVVNCTPAVYSCISEVPALYRMEFSQRPDNKGKPVPILVGVEYVAPVDFEPEL